MEFCTLDCYNTATVAESVVFILFGKADREISNALSSLYATISELCLLQQQRLIVMDEFRSSLLNC